VEALGRLAGGVAHDFNNALTIVLGSADLALTDRSLSAEVRACLEDITRASKQAADLTRSGSELGVD
jgi:signal transduction histidine kinase